MLANRVVPVLSFALFRGFVLFRGFLVGLPSDAFGVALSVAIILLDICVFPLRPILLAHQAKGLGLLVDNFWADLV